MLLLLALCEALGAQPSDLQFQRISIEQGLSQSSVQAVVQDQTGYLWLGTQDGLNRYDGYQFRVYRNEPNNSASLSGNYIYALCEDRQGNLWVGTRANGLNRFDPATGRVTRFHSDAADPASLSHQTVRAIIEDIQGIIWVGTEGGLNRFEPASGTFRRYLSDANDPESLSDNFVQALAGDRQGRLWIGTNNGLNCFDPATGKFTRFQHNPTDPASLSGDRIRTLRISQTGSLWLGTNASGFDRLDPLTGLVTHFSTSAQGGIGLPQLSSVRDIFEDRAGILWISTDNEGLVRFDPFSRTFSQYRHHPQIPTSLSNDSLRLTFQDRSGGFWVTTFGNGVNRLLQTGKFLCYRMDPQNPAGLSDNHVFSFCETRDGGLWVGTETGGLNRLDRATGRYDHYRHDAGNPASLGSDCVLAMYEDPSGRLWIGTKEGGLNRLDRATGKFTRFLLNRAPSNGLNPNTVRAICADRQGYLWLSTEGGVHRFDPVRETFVSYQHDPHNPQSLSFNNLRGMAPGPDGALWIATIGGGVNRLDPATGTFRRYRHDPNNPASLRTDAVRFVYVDRSGIVWAGTDGGGLNRLDPVSGQVTAFTMKEGLPNNVVYGILEDRQENLWLSTNYGICKFNPKTRACRVYDVHDGLQSNEFNQGAAFQNTSGELFFGGIGGYNIFRPETITDNPYIPPVVLTNYLKFDKPVETFNGTEIAPLEYTENFFAFEFAALNYVVPEKNQYAYRLEGFDRDWIYCGTRRYASYTNLDPGTYVFRVKGSNNDGGWNETGISLRVVVRPAPWRTWWAYGLYVAVAGGGLWGLFQVQINRVRTKARFREEKIKAQAAEIRAQVAEIQAQAIAAEDQRKTKELVFARQLQLSMLPRDNLRLEQVEIIGRMQTATEVGGDYYDFIALDENRYCVAIGDATGHGVGAGLVVGMVKMALTNAVQASGPTQTVQDILTGLNSSLKRSLSQRGVGMGLCLVFFDTIRLEAEICSAGMPFPFVFNQACGELTSLEMKSQPLGFLKKIRLSTHTVQLGPGDCLIFLSDGFQERMKADGQLWEYEAVVAELTGICQQAQTAAEIVNRLVAAADRFAEGAEPNDDMTAVVVRVLIQD
ncbi:MAG: SpoIIE family protein phosphatase [Blastocatellia bacterium]|nr:SpoIIE family protein phosphatase [Blastocatellia bacterium]